MNATTYDPMVLARARRLAADGTAKRLRLAARLSLGDVAQRLNVSASTVMRWEDGTSEPRREVGFAYGILLGELSRLQKRQRPGPRRGAARKSSDRGARRAVATG